MNFQSTKIILGLNIFAIFILFTLIYAKFYTNFSVNLTYYISLWFFNCFYFCNILKITWVINQIDFTSTSKFLVLIVFFSLNCPQLTTFKARYYRHFIGLNFCELIWEKFDEFLSFILHALFCAVILIYSSLNVVSFLNLKMFSYIFSYMCAFCKHKILAYCCFLIIFAQYLVIVDIVYV